MATVSKDFRIKNGLVVEGTTATVNGLNILTSGIFNTLNTFTTTQTITPSTSVTGLIINAAASSKGLILKNNATTPGNPFEIQNSGGSAIFTINSNGVINLGGATTIGNVLNFSDPGIAVETRFNFLRATDSAWLAINEMTSDSTYYEFGMADNPSGGDYFQWRFDNWEGPAYGWMPIQMSGYLNRFTAASNTMYGNFALPYNTPYATINNAAFNAANFNVNRYTPTQSTSQSLFKNSGTGTGTVTLNAQSFTGSSRTQYWIQIEAGATTFKWGNGSTGSTPVATGVAITGSAQILNNGVSVTISTTGHVAGDLWSFVSNPINTFAIGGTPITGAMQIIYPSSGVIGTIIRGASGQSVNLQEWQTSTPSTVASVSNTGNITAAQFIRTGGTASQFLKADGTVDSSTYLTTGTASSTYATLASPSLTGTPLSTTAAADTNTTQIATTAFVIGQASAATPAALGTAAIGTSLRYARADHVHPTTGLATLPSQTGNAGEFLITDGTSTSWSNTVTANATTSVGLVVKGLASQTGDLLQVHNSSSTVIANILSDGSLGAKSVTISGGGGQYVAGSIYSDANWGMLFRAKQASPVTAQFRWSKSDDVEVMRIDVSGNVGIGTSSPAAKLQVNGSTTVSSQVNVAAQIGPSVTSDVLIGSVNGNTPFVASQGAYPLAFFTNASERMRIDSAGLVGIGTNSPSYPLHVSNATGQIGVSSTTGTNFTRLLMQNTGGSFQLGIDNSVGGNYGFGAYSRVIWNDGAYPLVLTTNSLERMRIDSSGNVGIGGTSTGSKLQVFGSFAATTKSFVIDHPTKENMKLQYGSLEGPENGVYVRGKSKEKNIKLPDYWIGLVHEDSITVNLTSIGPGTLYVKKIIDNTVIVGGTAKEFFFTIYGERKDVDKLLVEY